MHPDALKFLEARRICVIALEMLDNAPHGSTVHFALARDPLRLIFLTEKRYRKAEPLFGREKTRASVVLGFDELEMATLQLDGNASLVLPEESNLKEIYFQKFPKKKEKLDEANDFFFKFEPTWWRFTDWTHPDGKKIYSSD